MPFPMSERVIYAKNPLKRVICQLRFPPILDIDASPPAGFQDQIRSEFPELQEQEELSIPLPREAQQIMPAEVLRQLSQSGRKNYEFGSPDGKLKINLTRTFLALTSTEYERWEVFRGLMKRPYRALCAEYKPAYFTRIGLRYVDVIRPAELNLATYEWQDLLEHHVLGMLGTSEVGRDVQATEATTVIRLDDDGSLARVLTRLNGHDEDRQFIIDTDFYHAGKTATDKAFEKLEFLHGNAYRLMRWCIKDVLHEAMGPAYIE